MLPQITEKQSWQIIHNTSQGDAVTPLCDAVYLTDEDAAKVYGVAIEDVERVVGYGARLHALACLLHTTWTVFGTKAEAANYLLETHSGSMDEIEMAELENMTTDV
jgi:hypothetical protein